MTNDSSLFDRTDHPLVLLIDDYEDNRLMASVILQSIGCQVAEAADADMAFALATTKRDKLNLVITDLSLPGTDGLTFIQQIKDRLSPIPVIVLTALSDPQLKEQLLSMGCCEYLTKPCLPEDLQAAVLRCLQQ